MLIKRPVVEFPRLKQLIKIYNKPMTDDFNHYHTLSEISVLCVGMNIVRYFIIKALPKPFR